MIYRAFWKEFEKSDSIKRIKMMESIINDIETYYKIIGNKNFRDYMIASSLASFFDDCIDTFKVKK